MCVCVCMHACGGCVYVCVCGECIWLMCVCVCVCGGCVCVCVCVCVLLVCACVHMFLLLTCRENLYFICSLILNCLLTKATVAETKSSPCYLVSTEPRWASDEEGVPSDRGEVHLSAGRRTVQGIDESVKAGPGQPCLLP